MSDKHTDITQALFAPDLMTVPEMAAYVRLTPATVRRLAGKGDIPGVRIGREFRFSKARVDAHFMAQVGVK